MKIGIYCEPHIGALGGSEYCVAVLAEALRTSHDVEIVNHRMDLTIGEVSRVFGTQLDGVGLRRVPHRWPSYRGPAEFWKRFPEARQWLGELSEPYDLFINFTHGLPPFCHAPIGVLFVLFPWFDRRREGPGRYNDDALRSGLRRIYSDWEWERRFRTYQTKIAISRFTREYARKWWALDCQILYPPTSNDFSPTDKSNVILSVGRFATRGHSKKQLEMMTTFRERTRSELAEWDYYCVGGLGPLAEDWDYFESVRRRAAGQRAHVVANIERAELRKLFERSKIFWHAAGFDEDEDRHPQLCEHFGIVTVEAMAAGCVPVVIDKGAQAEIVEHGVSGFLWNTLDELMEYTAILARDDSLRQRMSRSARVRARLYSKEAFVSGFSRLLGL